MLGNFSMTSIPKPIGFYTGVANWNVVNNFADEPETKIEPSCVGSVMLQVKSSIIYFCH